MSSYEAPRCRHIKGNGVQCGSPALQDNLFCYYHQRCCTVKFEYGRNRGDYSRSDITLPVFEDAHSIQLTLRRVTELVLRHQIDQKDASLVLYALQLAMFNLKRMESEAPKPEEIVTAEPPPDRTEESREQREAREKAENDEFIAKALAMRKPCPEGTDPSQMYGLDDPAARAYYINLKKRLAAASTPPSASTTTSGKT